MLIIILIIIVIFFYYINGYILLNIINFILKQSINPEFIDTTNIEWCKILRDNYSVIKKEYLNNTHKLKRFKDVDPNQSYVDTGNIPWNILMLRVYNKDTSNIHYFPETYKLIKNIKGCSLAMFSVLEPGKKIEPHFGPYNGVLRYHLSLIVPKNNNECFLILNNKKYIWKDKTDILFNDTYLHHAENNTNEQRIVLFLDIQKKYNNVFLDYINDLFLYCASFNKTVKDIVNNSK